MAKVYSVEEVGRHNKEDDLWIIIHGCVYDLTKFRQEHPGGEEVLLSLAGQDGTTCFDEIGHSEEAIQLRETFKIGRLPTESGKSNAPGIDRSATASGTADAAANNRIQQNNENDDDWEYEEPKRESSPWLPVFLALAVAVYATLIYCLWF